MSCLCSTLMALDLYLSNEIANGTCSIGTDYYEAHLLCRWKFLPLLEQTFLLQCHDSGVVALTFLSPLKGPECLDDKWPISIVSGCLILG